jgi:integrase
MPLSDTTIRNAKPKDKPYKLTDGRGLFLLINPRGGKGWRFKYRFGGKEKLLSFGTFPEIGLGDARKCREETREMVAKGIDPSAARKAAKAAKDESNANRFEVVAREWIGQQKNKWTPANKKVVTRQLENDIFPWIGKSPIAELKAPELLKVLRRMEERGVLDSAHRARTIAGQVFRYAIATGRAERDIAADLRGALAQPKKKHLPAITEPKKVAELLRAMDAFEGSLVVKCALRLAPLFFVRPGELRKAEWSEIDLDAAEWNIPAEKMKMKQAHLVPLSTQAVAILQELQPLTGRGSYVFPGARSAARPLSDMALSAAIRRLGYEQGEMTPHGFRAMARTILDEVLQVRPDFIEHQLAHAVRDANGRAYNRTSHLAERKKMMQVWADYLDGLKAGAKVIPLRAKQ